MATVAPEAAPSLAGPEGPGAGPSAPALPVSPTPTAATPPPAAPSIGPVDPTKAISDTVHAAPELANDPGTAVAVANGGGDVAGKAQAVAQAGKRQAIAQAHSNLASSGGFWGDVDKVTNVVNQDLEKVESPVKAAATGVMKLANAPLRTVQHEYRYLHDVEARHGRTAAMVEGLGLLLGAAAGTVVDPGEGTMAGIDAAGWIEGQVAYKDSWQRTADGSTYRDPHTGQLVSFGRDITSGLGINDTSGVGKTLSGAVDGIADLIADPVALAGKAYGAANDIGGMGGAAGKIFKGTSAATAEDVQNAWNTSLRFRTAAADIAGSDAGTIAVRYPKLAGIATELEKADGAQGVKEVMMQLAGTNEMLQVDTVPTLALGHIPFRALRETAANAGEGAISDTTGPLGFIGRHFAHNKVIGPRTWADRTTSLPGNTLDPASLDFMHGKLSLTDNTGAQDLYRFVRYGQGDRIAKDTVNNFLHSDPGQRYTIVKNAMFSTILRMAHEKVPDSGDLGDYMEELGRGDVKRSLEEQFKNSMQMANIEGAGDPGHTYGIDELGNNIKGPMVNGKEIPAGITANQTGHVTLPNIVEARRMAQAIRATKVSKLLAAADDFLNNHFTQAIWKPLELLSGGYAAHISFAEFIPNALRNGVYATTKTMYTRVLARMGYSNLEQEDVPALAGWLWKLGGKRAFDNSDDAERTMQMYAATGGYSRPPGLASGEMTMGEIQPSSVAENGFKQPGAVPGYKSSEWTAYGDNSPEFTELWQKQFRESANDKWSRTAAKAYLDAARAGKNQVEGTIAARQAVAAQLREEPDDVLKAMARSMGRRSTAPPGWDNIDDWADSIVSKMKGNIHARPPDSDAKFAGKANVDLLTSMANGHTPEIGDFEKIAVKDRPLLVKGQLMTPSTQGIVQKIANKGFETVIDPFVNIISRNQEYVVEYLKQSHALDDAVESGRMSEDQRLVMAMSRAAAHSERFVHNLTDRTQWTATLRNWAPFFFAQEQAYRRMGRFLVEDPGGFRRYQMMITAVGHIANTYSDGQGNEYITFPGSGFLGKGIAHAMGMSGLMLGSVPPAQFGGSLSSSSVVFPLSTGALPELSPIAAIPAQQLSTQFLQLGKRFPGFGKVINPVVSALSAVDDSGYTSDESILEQLIPNEFALRVVQIYEAQHGGQVGFNSTVMQVYNLLDYQQAEATEKWLKDGSKGPVPNIVPPQTASPMEKQQFQDKVRNYVTSLYITRAITGLVSPVSSEIEIQNFGMTDKLSAAISKAGSVDLGMQNFLLAHPAASPYTVAESFNPSAVDPTKSSGYSLSSSIPAQQWITQHQALVNKYGPAALWLMPQLKNETYSSTVYNEQIAQGLRVKDTPQEYLTALYVAAGDDIYYKGLSSFESALASVGNNETEKNALYNNWDAYVKQLAVQYPVWYEDFSSNIRQDNALQTISKLQQIYQNGEAPKDEQSTMVEKLLRNFDTVSTQYNNAGNGVSYSTQLTNQSNISASWLNWLDTVASQDPQLKPIIQSVFKNALKVQT